MQLPQFAVLQPPTDDGPGPSAGTTSVAEPDVAFQSVFREDPVAAMQASFVEPAPDASINMGQREFAVVPHGVDTVSISDWFAGTLGFGPEASQIDLEVPNAGETGLMQRTSVGDSTPSATATQISNQKLALFSTSGPPAPLITADPNSSFVVPVTMGKAQAGGVGQVPDVAQPPYHVDDAQIGRKELSAPVVEAGEDHPKQPAQPNLARAGRGNGTSGTFPRRTDPGLLAGPQTRTSEGHDVTGNVRVASTDIPSAQEPRGAGTGARIQENGQAKVLLPNGARLGSHVPGDGNPSLPRAHIDSPIAGVATKIGPDADAAPVSPTAVRPHAGLDGNELPRLGAEPSHPPPTEARSKRHALSPTLSTPPVSSLLDAQKAAKQDLDTQIREKTQAQPGASQDANQNGAGTRAERKADAFGSTQPVASVPTGAAAMPLASADAATLSFGADAIAVDIGLTEPRNAARPALIPEMAVLARPETPRQIAVQIVEAARGSRDGAIEMTLQPEELGRVSMTMKAENGGLSVLISIERPETLELMRRHIELLSEDLRRLGYGSVDVAFQGGGQGGGGRASENDQTASDPGDQATVVVEPTDTPQPQRARAGREGVDLRL